MLWLLQKSLKSLQTHLQAFLGQLAEGTPAPGLSGGALTHARAKLCASAFVELNAQAVWPAVYGPEHAALCQRWQGHRLLAGDSALVRLPSRDAVGHHFGWVQCANQHGPQERYPQARVSVLYDLLNQVGLEGRLAAGTVAETQMAHEHLAAVAPGDVLLNDRGDTGYRWGSAVRAVGAHFVSRCSRGSFAAVQQLFARDEAGVSVVVTLAAPKAVRAECRARDWPLECRVRLVTVRLASGELEVLATSLLDEAAYPTEALAAVYWQRWGHETYYGRRKGRLDLEHCSGQTVAAVEQDFHATVLLANVESVVTGPAQAALSARTAARAQPARVNRAVRLHALKHRLIDLLTSRGPGDGGAGRINNLVSSQPGERAAGTKGAPAGTLAGALLPLPTPYAQNGVLNMDSLFQRQCTLRWARSALGSRFSLVGTPKGAGTRNAPTAAKNGAACSRAGTNGGGNCPSRTNCSWPWARPGKRPVNFMRGGTSPCPQ